MPVDGLVTKIIADELNGELIGARLERLSMPDRHSLFMQWHGIRGRRRLLLGTNPSAPVLQWGANLKFEAMNPPPPFMLPLRKHIQGGRLRSVSVPPNERIFIFEFEVLDTFGDRTIKRLIVEFMNRTGNMILVNASGIIHDALRHVDHTVNRYRETLPAHPYTPPPPQKKVSPAEVIHYTPDSLFTQQSNADRITAAVYKNIAGFSPVLGTEAVFRANLDPRLSYGSLTAEARTQLYGSVRELCDQYIHGMFSPAVYYDTSPQDSGALAKEVHILPLTHLRNNVLFPDILSAVTAYYQSKITADHFRALKDRLTRSVSEAIKKAEHKHDLHTDDLRQGSRAERDRHAGELLLAYLHQVDPKQGYVILPDYDDDNRPVTIRLDPRYSPADNANRYFRRYARNKRRYEQARRLLQEDQHLLGYLDSLRVALDCAENSDDLAMIADEWNDYRRRGRTRNSTESPHEHGLPGKPAGRKRRRLREQKQRARTATEAKRKEKKPSLPPRRYRSDDGFAICIGRNNRQNDLLTFKKARKDDLWFHVKDAPGAHVVVMAEGKAVPPRTLEQAAGLAAWFSGTNRAGGSKTDIDYCKVRHVTKPKGANPGQVIYRNFSTLTVYPLDPAKLISET